MDIELPLFWQLLFPKTGLKTEQLSQHERIGEKSISMTLRLNAMKEKKTLLPTQSVEYKRGEQHYESAKRNGPFTRQPY